MRGQPVMALSGIHVLFVDNNKQMRSIMRSVLRAGGIGRISEAETGAQAFDLLSASPVDLVIFDWKTAAPLDALDFTTMVRRNLKGLNPCIPILMLTDHGEVSRVLAARDAGVSGFVKKPISAQQLVDRIAGALSDARPFVRSEGFVGPDRRFCQDPNYAGPLRRASDKPESSAPPAASGDELDLDDLRWTA